MSYSILIHKSAQKSLLKIERPAQDRIIKAIRNLSGNPRPHGAKKLAGRPAWRIRIGDYRVIYEIHDRELIVIVVVIGHRRNIYEQNS